MVFPPAVFLEHAALLHVDVLSVFLPFYVDPFSFLAFYLFTYIDILM